MTLSLGFQSRMNPVTRYAFWLYVADLCVLWCRAFGNKFSNLLFKYLQEEATIIFGTGHTNIFVTCESLYLFSRSCIDRTFDGEPSVFTGLDFTIRIKRNPTFYELVIVKPSLILSAMTIFMFLMPPSATDRYSYGKTMNTTVVQAE